jgi:hypothetical protein
MTVPATECRRGTPQSFGEPKALPRQVKFRLMPMYDFSTYRTKKEWGGRFIVSYVPESMHSDARTNWVISLCDYIFPLSHVKTKG